MGITMKKPSLLIFASGTATGGGSGFANLVKASRSGILSAEIVGVVSNHENGGVRKYADDLGIPFLYFAGPWDAENYQRIVISFGAEFVALSGWLKPVRGLDPRIVFNIHPGRLPQFGGKGMHGHHVHKATMAAFWAKKITHTAVTFHHVTEEYDTGQIIAEFLIEILPDDTPESLAKRVNEAEHHWQPIITDMVVNGEIQWDGKPVDGPLLKLESNTIV